MDRFLKQADDTTRGGLHCRLLTPDGWVPQTSRAREYKDTESRTWLPRHLFPTVRLTHIQTPDTMDHTHPTSTSFLTPTVSEFYNVHPANSAFDAEPDSSVCYNFPPLWCSLDVLSDDTLTAHSHLSHPIPGAHRGAAAFGHVDSQL